MALVVESQWGQQNDDDVVLLDVERPGVFEGGRSNASALIPGEMTLARMAPSR